MKDNHHTKKILKDKVRIVKDKALDLETNSLIRKIANLAFIPFLNALPIKSRSLIKKSNKAVSDIVDNATSHKALEILYSKGHKKGVKKIYEKVSHIIWFSTNNSKAVRNRLKIVTKEIKDILARAISVRDTINVVSIAAGSARAVIESLEYTKTQDKNFKITFVDKSPQALEYSKELLKEFSISKMSNYSFEWINSTVNEFLDSTTCKYSLVEMVGLMDYFNDEKAQAIFSKIYSILDAGGHFITANINDNSEKRFVTKAIGWPMIYRKAEHLAKLVNDAGFPHSEMDVYYEPLKIHSIIVARRSV